MRRLLAGPRFENALKALLLLALALFLYTRLADGTLFFYINQRFMAYTMLAIVGLLCVAISYRPVGRRLRAATVTAPDHEHDHAHDHPHDHAGDHSHDDHSGHNHRLTWAGVALVLLPIVLGVVVPPQPLGAAAIGNREVNVTSSGSALPAAVRAAAEKAAADKNQLDWLNTFAGSAHPAEDFAGQPVDVIGFVFRDERFAEDQFMVTRFVVSCCVADANVAGMVVESPATATLAADQCGHASAVSTGWWPSWR
jgi:uncharacterized repeat protein (TIGR03943 family)